VVVVDLARMKQLAASGAIHYEWKAVSMVAETLGITFRDARLTILGFIEALAVDDYCEPAKGDKDPLCDVYSYTQSHLNLDTVQWETFNWYVKIGIDEGPPPQTWVESCHQPMHRMR
jgi:hypothetical protein